MDSFEGSLNNAELGATALLGAVFVTGLRSLLVDGRIAVDRVLNLIGPVFWQGIAPTPDSPLPGLGG